MLALAEWLEYAQAVDRQTLVSLDPPTAALSPPVLSAVQAELAGLETQLADIAQRRTALEDEQRRVWTRLLDCLGYLAAQCAPPPPAPVPCVPVRRLYAVAPAPSTLAGLVVQCVEEAGKPLRAKGVQSQLWRLGHSPTTETVAALLSQQARKGHIRRLGRGLYCPLPAAQWSTV